MVHDRDFGAGNNERYDAADRARRPLHRNEHGCRAAVVIEIVSLTVIRNQPSPY